MRGCDPFAILAAFALDESDREALPRGADPALVPAASMDASGIAVAAVAVAPAADLPAILTSLDQAGVDEDKRHAAARADLAVKRAAAINAWVWTTNVHDAPLPALSADPREGEARDHHARIELNNVLAILRRQQQEGHAGAYGNVGTSRGTTGGFSFRRAGRGSPGRSTGPRRAAHGHASQTNTARGTVTGLPARPERNAFHGFP